MHWAWAKRDTYGLARFATPRAAKLLRFEISPVEATSENARYSLVHSIYDALVAKRIQYAFAAYQPDRAVQAIRTPAEIVDKPGLGTCLDLSLLFAGLCLEAELFPT